jgi:hypothetical protein
VKPDALNLDGHQAAVAPIVIQPELAFHDALIVRRLSENCALLRSFLQRVRKRPRRHRLSAVL